MASKKIQLYTDRDKTIEASPETSANCVILSDGNDLQKVLDNDLTNPTVVHEETSFKVGVGDIDVSSSVVDGEVGRMVIKGKTYQNILPEPSTHVLTNNKEMFKVNEGLDPNVEIVDAVSKSAILSGQTLVNLAPKKIIEYTASSDWDGFNVLVQNSKKPNEHWRTLQDLKPNTKYYISCYVETFEDVNGRDYHFNNSNQNCLFVDFMKVNGVGHYQWISTTRSELTDEIFIALRCQNAYARGAIKIRDIMIIEYQEGMENWEIPYFTGMQSVKLPVLQTVGKNLFDKSSLVYGGNGYSGATEYSPNLYNNTRATLSKGGLISVEPKSTITLSCDNRFKCVIQEYDKNEIATRPYDSGWHTNGHHTLTVNESTRKINIYFTKQDPYSTEVITGEELEALKDSIQVEVSSSATTYEPYKTNILHTPEEVVLSKVNDAIDTLNLNTGEYVKRVKEIVLDGSEPNSDFEFKTPTESLQTVRIDYMGIHDAIMVSRNKINCDRFLVTYDDTNDYEHVRNGGQAYRNIIFYINKSRLSELTLNGFKQWLSQNPVKLQYELATPFVKTVDLSSSGNWEKVVYNGMESWNKHDTWSSGELLAMHTSCRGKLVGGLAFSDKFDGMKFSEASSNSVATKECIRYDAGSATIYVFIKKSRLQESSIDGFKQWLKDNGLTVWYQTETHLDSTQVKQPIFFKDGHIIQTSGTDNSLIPTLDYQAKTSNSYVMDLLKLNTVYTIKATSASGNLLLTDGRQITLSTNRTFNIGATFPSDKLIINKGSATDLMILEGDITNKTIPYFKGIKSTFEDESKIEVLSSNCANLFHPKDIVNDNYWELDVTKKAKIFLSAPRRNAVNMVQRDSNGIQLMARVNEVEDQIEILPNAKTLRLVGGCFRPTDAWHELITQNLIVADAKSENNTKEIDYKSNSTKIPLLSPLRSLPNGVCDELIIDRMKKKATLIQRIKSTVFNGSEGWSLNGYSHDKLVEFVCHGSVQMAHAVFSDRFATGGENVERVAFGGGSIYIRILKTKVSNVDSFKKWLSQNPLTVQCGLQTPLITEIDLENFPLVYKDGHIFLNSEIAPVVEIDYSINQSQQIQSNNETLQRHELDILDLDNLIVSFVDCEYRLKLLAFNIQHDILGECK